MIRIRVPRLDHQGDKQHRNPLNFSPIPLFIAIQGTPVQIAVLGAAHPSQQVAEPCNRVPVTQHIVSAVKILHKHARSTSLTSDLLTRVAIHLPFPG